MSNVKEVFDKEVDSKINGLALAVAFSIIGLILLYIPNYFGNEKVTAVVRYIFIGIGAIGAIIELSSSKKKNGKVYGIDDFLLGTAFLVLWIFTYKFNSWLLNIAAFLILFIALYGMCLGIIKIIYSFYLICIDKAKSAKENNFNKNIVLTVIEAITKILALILAIIQVAKIVQT